MTFSYIPERAGVGRLGRHVFHDERNREFPARRASARKSVLHRRYGQILDQGNIGACTGFATADALNTARLTVPGHRMTNDDALAIYERATQLDSFSGSYPPNDTGSDGGSAAKAAREKCWITRYDWAFGIDHALDALQLSAVITGVQWYEGFDTPDSSGRVRLTGQVRGGHEFCVRGYDDKRKEVRCVNSWGPNWGIGGEFIMSVSDWSTLLQQSGDVTVLVR